MDEWDRPPLDRFREWIGTNWPVALGTAILTVLMIWAVSTMF